MQAGSLHCRIAILAPSLTADATGQPLNTYTLLCQRWASIRAATTKDVYASSGFVSQLSHVVTVRFSGVTVSPGCLVQYGTRNLRVQAVADPNEGHQELQLLCLEQT